MEVKLTNNRMPFENIDCPALNEPYIGTMYRNIVNNIIYGKTYYWYNDQTRELTAFKVLAMALHTEGQSYLLQFPDKKEWISNFFEKEYPNIFSDKEDFFQNIISRDRHFLPISENIGEMFPAYRYAAVVGFDRHTYVWRNGCPSKPNNAYIRYFMFTSNGVSACISQKDIDGKSVYLTREECVRHNLNKTTIRDFDTDLEPFRIEILEVKESCHKLRVLEF